VSEASLNGKHLLDYTLAEPVSGKVGVWSKTDSGSYFDDYTVTKEFGVRRQSEAPTALYVRQTSVCRCS
jgi:hypothetical protein